VKDGVTGRAKSVDLYAGPDPEIIVGQRNERRASGDEKGREV